MPLGVAGVWFLEATSARMDGSALKSSFGSTPRQNRRNGMQTYRYKHTDRHMYVYMYFIFTDQYMCKCYKNNKTLFKRVHVYACVCTSINSTVTKLLLGFGILGEH